MSKLYDRMRSVACRFWSCAPAQFDDWQASGRISFDDVYELIFQLMHDPIVGIWLADYLYPQARQQEKVETKRMEEEAELRKRDERVRMTALTMLARCKPKDDAEAASMAALRDRLNTES